jgi:hypothetical protein
MDDETLRFQQVRHLVAPQQDSLSTQYLREHVPSTIREQQDARDAGRPHLNMMYISRERLLPFYAAPARYNVNCGTDKFTSHGHTTSASLLQLDSILANVQDARYIERGEL